MTDRVMALARAARRAGLLAAMSGQRAELSLARLDVLLLEYGEDLGQLTVSDLMDLACDEFGQVSLHDEVMRAFRATPGIWLTSRFFIEQMGLPRWTAQAVLAELAERGCLIRAGVTSSTRYRLAVEDSAVEEERC